MALDAEAAEHHAERQVHPLEHRALLDVQLEVGHRPGEPLAGLAGAVEVDAVGGERVGQRDAVAVGEAAHGVRVERARARARAEQAAAEARALLVGPVDELDGDGPVPGGQRAHDLERAQHAERAVEPAAVGHRVEVAADDHEALGVAGQRRPRVARLVPLDRHAGDRVELGAQPVARGDPRVRPRDPLGAALVGGEAGELPEPPNGACGVDHGWSLADVNELGFPKGCRR